MAIQLGPYFLEKEHSEAYEALIRQEKKTVNDLLNTLNGLALSDAQLGTKYRPIAGTIKPFLANLRQYVPEQTREQNRAVIADMFMRISRQINSIIDYLSFFGMSRKKADELLTRRGGVLEMKKYYKDESEKFFKTAMKTLAELAKFVRSNSSDLQGNPRLYENFAIQLSELRYGPPSAILNLFDKISFQIMHVELANSPKIIMTKGITREQIAEEYGETTERAKAKLTSFNAQLQALRNELLPAGTVGAAYRGWATAIAEVKATFAKDMEEIRRYLEFGSSILPALRDNATKVKSWIERLKATKEQVYGDIIKLLQRVDEVEKAYKALSRTSPEIIEIEKRMAA